MIFERTNILTHREDIKNQIVTDMGLEIISRKFLVGKYFPKRVFWQIFILENFDKENIGIIEVSANGSSAK